MSLSEHDLARRISRGFSARIRQAWLRNYSYWKILTDPAYRTSAAELGASMLPLLDIGCGAGLHAFYLRERGYAGPIIGIDIDAAKVREGRALAAARYPGIDLRVGDGASVQEFCGNITILDVIHYFPDATREALLARLASQVAPGGLCLIRTTLHDGSWRHRATILEERIARTVRWMRADMVRFPTAAELCAHFPAGEFTHEVRPLWGRTPFNSHVLIFRRSGSST
jgi:SAM-dependent methyltransferase